jgi:flagellar basal-body rod modification protein FlgD
MVTNTIATNPQVATGATAATGTAASATSATSIGGTDFLTLMLAQLKNQDPTSPADSNTFLTQLAQLSQVQGLNTLNNSFASLSGSLVSSQAMQASSLLGHTALVSSPTASIGAAGQTVSGAINVPLLTSQVLLNIKDSAGNLVQQIDLGKQPAGMTTFTWNGRLGDGSQAPPGTYTLSAQAAGAPKGTVVGTYVNGTVDSVTMGAGGSGLSLDVSGLGSVPFSNVQQISN